MDLLKVRQVYNKVDKVKRILVVLDDKDSKEEIHSVLNVENLGIINSEVVCINVEIQMNKIDP